MIRILIADDHAIVRKGLKQIVSDAPDKATVGEAQNAYELLEHVRNQTWDVVILDMSMPGKSGLDLLQELHYQRPKLPILALSIHPEDQFAIRVLKAGAAGYLTKEISPEELVRAIWKVAHGGKYVSPTLAEKLALDLQSDRDKLPHEQLSDREYEVLLMIACGTSAGAMADRLSLSVKTIHTYRARLMEKMRITSNAEIIHYAIRHRLLDEYEE
ncbi:MAG: response regulator transcription factor [Acidobacteria bacterium]|nr:response regulator transcription factor [Acidobacteriota bacterium]MBI3657920.1 response regulator transcription factor [Acidobacteriota bacterium]